MKQRVRDWLVVNEVGHFLKRGGVNKMISMVVQCTPPHIHTSPTPPHTLLMRPLMDLRSASHVSRWYSRELLSCRRFIVGGMGVIRGDGRMILIIIYFFKKKNNTHTQTRHTYTSPHRDIHTQDTRQTRTGLMPCASMALRIWASLKGGMYTPPVLCRRRCRCCVCMCVWKDWEGGGGVRE